MTCREGTVQCHAERQHDTEAPLQTDKWSLYTWSEVIEIISRLQCGPFISFCSVLMKTAKHNAIEPTTIDFYYWHERANMETVLEHSPLTGISFCGAVSQCRNGQHHLADLLRKTTIKPIFIYL